MNFALFLAFAIASITASTASATTAQALNHSASGHHDYNDYDWPPNELIYLNEQYQFHILAWYSLHQKSIAFSDQGTCFTLNIAAKHNLCHEVLMTPPSIPSAAEQLGIQGDFDSPQDPYHSSYLLGLQAIAHVVNEHHSIHQGIYRQSGSTSEQRFNIDTMNEDFAETIPTRRAMPGFGAVPFYSGLGATRKPIKFAMASGFIIFVMSLKFLGFRRYQ